MDKFTITFKPDNKTTEAKKGQELLTAALACGIHINSSCGGDGVCGRCKVIIKKGEIHTEPSGRISHAERELGFCLACQTTVHSDLEVEVPQQSRLDLEKVSPEDAKLLRLKGVYSQAEETDKGKSLVEENVFKHSPLATKLYLEIEPPTLSDNISDLERLYRAIRRNRDIPIMQTGIANIKRLGKLLRESNWQITVTLGKRNETTEIVLIEPGNTSETNFGFAFDIGTTTVVGQLINLNTKQVLGTKVTHNMQAVFGSDVISRIIYASEKDGLEKLHHAVIDNINDIIQSLIREHNIKLNNVTGVMCAGNMTMVHLLLRIDPTFIRREPYTPTANFIPVIRAGEAGIKINPRGLLNCVPGVSTYVGGDIIAGVLASGIDQREELSLLIDVGTNGEIVLGNSEWLVSCACSAGPAFEGSGVTCGMRATKGAIQRVKIQDDSVEVTTIGDCRPRGICGSGLIDALAELFTRGIVDRQGKIVKEKSPERVRTGKYGLEFILVREKEADCDYDIVISEADIDNLIRSKGAINAGTSILLKKMGLDFAEINKILIAGGFGTYLDIEKAITIGLLPELSVDKFEFIGNSSLVGARELLLSYDAMRQAEIIARKMTYFELSAEPAYMDEYVFNLFLPHT